MEGLAFAFYRRGLVAWFGMVCLAWLLGLTGLAVVWSDLAVV